MSLPLDAHLAHIHLLSTKLVIAPHDAAAPLRDLAQHTSALAHATRLLHDDLHGATLTKLVRNRVSDIIDTVGALARDNPKDYLVRVGTLHDLIAAGIPKDNHAAACLAWKSDCDSLQDNLQEIDRIITQTEPDDADDGWDELGLANITDLDEVELARAKNVHQLLRLTTLLHKRIFLDLLSHPSSAPLTALDTLVRQSNLLLSTSDDLVAALYTPQDPDHVRDHIQHLANITTSFQTQIAVLLPLTDQLQALTLNTSAKKRADKKWFDTCVDQIHRLSSRLTSPSESTA